MRLKSFHGATMFDAMSQVRRELGSEALIVSTFEGEDGVRITAALQRDEKTESQTTSFYGKMNHFRQLEVASRLLHLHRVPDSLIEATMKKLSPKISYNEGDRHILNEGLFDDIITYRPLLQNGLIDPLLSAWMFVGASGVGKTVAIAKYAAEALTFNIPVEVITCDATKAGAIAQLETYMNALELNLTVCRTPDELGVKLEEYAGQALILIDTPGTNYRSESETSRLFDYIVRLKQPPVYVTTAGGEAEEESDRYQVFHSLGCTRHIITKIDASKRLAGGLVPLLTQSMSLCGMTESPLISDPVIHANSHNFHKMLTNYYETPEILEGVQEQGEGDDNSYKTEIQAY